MLPRPVVGGCASGAHMEFCFALGHGWREGSASLVRGLEAFVPEHARA